MWSGNVDTLKMALNDQCDMCKQVHVEYLFASQYAPHTPYTLLDPQEKISDVFYRNKTIELLIMRE